MQDEHISFIVVIIGPLATAGSTFIFLNKIGKINPKIDDTEIDITNDTPTQVEINIQSKIWNVPPTTTV